MNRWPDVHAWLDRLDEALPLVPDLSPEGALLGLAAARSTLQDVPRHTDRPAPAHTVFVASSTVFTVALEWCAVLLARGGAVTVKSPRALAAWYDALAAATSLPLRATTDRSVLAEADRVVLMGSDATVEAVRATLTHPERLLAFGSRYSLAWWTDPRNVGAVALDHVLYDNRGCMAPTGIFSPLPDAADRLAAYLEQVTVPVGRIHDEEHAWIRERRALARVVGRVVSERVIELPPAYWSPRTAPGLAVVHPLKRFEDLPVRPKAVSVLGTDDARRPDVRCEALGRMQRPPLDRCHDGIRWLTVL